MSIPKPSCSRSPSEGERQARLTAFQVEKILKSNAFELIGQKGSHRKWWHPERRAIVVVPEHAGKVLPIGTLAQIIRASGIPKKNWRV